MSRSNLNLSFSVYLLRLHHPSFRVLKDHVPYFIPRIRYFVIFVNLTNLLIYFPNSNRRSSHPFHSSIVDIWLILLEHIDSILFIISRLNCKHSV